MPILLLLRKLLLLLLLLLPWRKLQLLLLLLLLFSWRPLLLLLLLVTYHGVLNVRREQAAGQFTYWKDPTPDETSSL